MKFFVIPAIFFTFFHLNQAGPLRLQKRAAFYIANETACVVDNTVYNSGDPIPTDDPCEACRCRPPGFACVLKECESKPGCRAVRRVGQCCPEYICDSENSTNVDYAFSSEKAYSVEETTVSPKASESTLYSEIPENIADTQVTKKESEKVSSEASPPESLDSSLLFSVSEGEGAYKEAETNKETEANKEAETTKKDTSFESVSNVDSGETILEAESSEDNSSEKQIENVTKLIKSDFEIMKDDEQPEELEVTPEQGAAEVSADPDHSVKVSADPNHSAEVSADPDHSVEVSADPDHSAEVSADPDHSAVTDKNVEIFPVEESTTVEVKFKTAPPTEVTGPVTVSSTTVMSDSSEDIDDKANELIKRFRSLKNLTSDDATKSPIENVEVKGDDSNDASRKETTEKEVTSAVTEKLTTVKLEKEIVVADGKSSDTTTEAVPTLYYISDAKVSSESVETVTAVVEVKEPTSSEKIDVETSSPLVSNESEQVLSKAVSEVPETNNNQEITMKSNGETAIQTTIEISSSTTPQVADLSTTVKSEEKVQLSADNSKIVASTEAPKVTEVVSSTTVVTEINSQKVEPSKD